MKLSYYQSKLIDPKRHLVVQISNGKPRWGARPEVVWPELFPPLEIVHAGLSEAECSRAYFRHLDSVGGETITCQMAELERAATAQGKEPVLCCFESLKTRGQFCHRTMFAKWWRKHTGVAIPELAEPPTRATVGQRELGV